MKSLQEYKSLTYFLVLLFFLACKDDENVVFQGNVSNIGNYKMINTTLGFYRDTTLNITFKGYADTLGNFKFSGINEGFYYVKVSATGYESKKDSVYIGGSVTKNFILSGSVSLLGSLTNAVTGDPVSGASIRFFRVNETTFVADTISEINTITQDGGNFDLTNLPTGRFKILFSKQGFSLRTVNINCEKDDQVNLGKLILVPPISGGKLNIVLNWSQTPSNLDIYLFGPGNDGNFVCHAGNPLPVGGGVEMLHLSSNGFGPETLQINNLHNGVYTLAVCNKSNLSATGGVEIYESKAKVQVFNVDGLLQTFTAPPATEGNSWEVFKMTVSPGLIQIDAANQYQYIDSIP